MSWETLAYTDAGIELLMDAVSGKMCIRDSSD